MGHFTVIHCTSIVRQMIYLFLLMWLLLYKVRVLLKMYFGLGEGQWSVVKDDVIGTHFNFALNDRAPLLSDTRCER